MTRMVRWVSLFFLVCLTGIVWASDSCSPSSCMIVIDAGSSGSRAHLYHYQLEGNGAVPVIEEVAVQKIEPGLSQFVEKPNEVELYLERLIGRLEGVAGLPVYFYATAGMRIVASEKQRELYHVVQTWFSRHSKLKLVDIKTIPGSDEGVYGWLAVNYIAGALNSSSDLVGVMDFGGASVQVIFPISSATESFADKKFIREIEVGGKHFQLYSRSFLGLGINTITSQFLDESACFSKNYPLPDGELGQGDLFSCERDIETVTNQLHHVSDVTPLLTANNPKQWVALGSLPYLHLSKPFETLVSPLTMRDVTELAQSGVCGEDWNNLSQLSDTDNYLYRACFASAYYYALVVKGYGLNTNTPIQTEMHGLVPDWTYGVVLLKSQPK